MFRVKSDKGVADELESTVRFYNEAAARYDHEVDAVSENASIRDAFQKRVSALAGAEGLILDFGCGTGIDASWYAARGHRVLAYDRAPRMVELVRVRCRDAVEAQRIIPVEGSLDALTSALDRTGAVRAVAANFAVLNHVRDLKPLLRLFGSHLVADGALIASLLNPWYRHDIKTAWWWRAALPSIWTGALRFAGDVTTYRHFTRTVRLAAAPEFTLTDVCAPAGTAWKDILDSNFLFLVLRKL